MDGHERTDSEYVKETISQKRTFTGFPLFHRSCFHCAADRVCAHPGIHSHRETQRGKGLSGMVPAPCSPVCGCALPAVHSVPGIHHQAGIPHTGAPSGAQGFQVHLSLPRPYRSLQNQHVCGALCILHGFVCSRHGHLYYHRHTFSLRAFQVPLYILPVLLKDIW